MHLAHQIRLDPTPSQENYFARAAGTCRMVYNWTLDEWQEQYKACKLDKDLPKPNAYAIQKQFTAVRKELFPWSTEICSHAQAHTIQDVGVAYQNFFKGRSKYPKFKTKRTAKKSFYVHNAHLKFDSKDRVKLPMIGWVRCSEPFRFAEMGKVQSARITKTDDRDVNAARNLEKLGTRGPEVTSVERLALVQTRSMKGTCGTKLNSKKQKLPSS